MNQTSLPQTVTQEITAPDLKPIWIRLPQVIAVYGLSRTKAFQLAKDGKITSVSLREHGQTKATRLFSVESLEGYINSFLPPHPKGNSAPQNQ